MTDEKYEKAMSLVTCVLDYEHFKDVDLVIEASLYSRTKFTCLL
jgi:enoyl-CoA hydratase/3-hydroxyacyl-CoA dehydrogenase